MPSDHERAIMDLAAHLPPDTVPEPAEPVQDDAEESDTAKCACCGEQHDREDMVHAIDSDGEIIIGAEECLRGGYFIELEYRSYSERRGPMGVVRWYHVDNCVSTESGTWATQSYAESSWYWSSNDEQWYESYESSSEYAEEQERESEQGDMYGYDTDILDVHGWPDATPTDSLCFGVELECESANESAREVTEALGNRDGDGSQYILKSDGSIDNGTEIVTLPYTLEYHQAKFNWRRVLKPVQGVANSGSGTTQCGIHVHINRAAVSALTLGKMLVFVNDPRNIRAITGIAQRSESSWAKFHTKKLTDGMSGKYSIDDRYQALNVRPNTIEVRIFRGNLRAERVLKNIEFCHALVSYCRVASMQSLNWELFWAWLRSTPANRKQYGNLIDFAHELLNRRENDLETTDKDI